MRRCRVLRDRVGESASCRPDCSPPNLVQDIVPSPKRPRVEKAPARDGSADAHWADHQTLAHVSAAIIRLGSLMRSAHTFPLGVRQYDLERRHRVAKAYGPRRAPWRDGLPIQSGNPGWATGFRRAGLASIRSPDYPRRSAGGSPIHVPPALATAQSIQLASQKTTLDPQNVKQASTKCRLSRGTPCHIVHL
ncbi:hypothetical protein B0G84_7233 [Paraburkholderia sp. BL8N3]|nr:hypothetical protein B0G84_7233 [Paraburkholderia sp. BL8N3]